LTRISIERFLEGLLLSRGIDFVKTQTALAAEPLRGDPRRSDLAAEVSRDEGDDMREED
jgi:hypothetical protein